jgi:hypothetical protein
MPTIMLDPQAPAAARATCANSILDRGWGRAVERREDVTPRRSEAAINARLRARKGRSCWTCWKRAGGWKRRKSNPSSGGTTLTACGKAAHRLRALHRTGMYGAGEPPRSARLWRYAGPSCHPRPICFRAAQLRYLRFRNNCSWLGRKPEHGDHSRLSCKTSRGYG